MSVTFLTTGFAATVCSGDWKAHSDDDKKYLTRLYPVHRLQF